MGIGFMAETHLSQATDIFLFDCGAVGWRQQTRRRYQAILTSFILFTGDMLVRELAPDHVRLYIAELADRPGKGTKHLRQHYAVIRMWVRWLYAQKQITERGSFDKALRLRIPFMSFSNEELTFCLPEHKGE